jgi:hypothetical protein
VLILKAAPTRAFEAFSAEIPSTYAFFSRQDLTF